MSYLYQCDYLHCKEIIADVVYELNLKASHDRVIMTTMHFHWECLGEYTKPPSPDA